MQLITKVGVVLTIYIKKLKNYYTMSRIEKLLEYLKTSGKDSFLQHALALEYIKVGSDEEARKLFNEILLREPTYIGSYYHLGKLLERVADFDRAIRIYKRGMEEAKRAGDNHSYNELQGALEDLEE
ncbi:tetratricopeptide repeat protein [Ferruginibacter sp.]|uniref:tetratricopeptide repeat protein n=1 Tax=Ferruginibacter sp. TaxID=1940288 RepID=UPI00374DC5E7